MRSKLFITWLVTLVFMAAGKVTAQNPPADDLNLKSGQMQDVRVPEDVISNRPANIAYYSMMPKGYASIRPSSSNRAIVMNAGVESEPVVDPWEEMQEIARRKAADTGAHPLSVQTEYLRNTTLLDVLQPIDPRTLSSDVRAFHFRTLATRTLNIATYHR